MEQRRGKGQDLRYLSRRRKLDSLSTELYIFCYNVSLCKIEAKTIQWKHIFKYYKCASIPRARIEMSWLRSMSTRTKSMSRTAAARYPEILVLSD